MGMDVCKLTQMSNVKITKRNVTSYPPQATSSVVLSLSQQTVIKLYTKNLRYSFVVCLYVRFVNRKITELYKLRFLMIVHRYVCIWNTNR